MKVDEMLAKLFRPPRILLLGGGAADIKQTVQRDYECDVEETDEIDCCAPKLKLDRYDLILIGLAQTQEIVRAVKTIRQLAPLTPLLVVADKTLAPVVNAIDTEVAFIRSTCGLNWDALFRRLRIRVKTKAAPAARPVETEPARQMQVVVG